MFSYFLLCFNKRLKRDQSINFCPINRQFNKLPKKHVLTNFKLETKHSTSLTQYKHNFNIIFKHE
jgi:hypothetical protein